MRLLADGPLQLADGLIGAGGDLSWPRVTRPGDILHVESEVLEIKPSRSKPDRAIVMLRSDTMNQRGEIAQTFVARLLVFRRPAA
jgi:acyl dehydratase